MYVLKMWDRASGQWIPIAFSSPPSSGPSSAMDHAGNIATPCVTFTSHGASICNDTAGVIHFNTPDAQYAMDATGFTLPGGHRLEVVPP